MHDLGAAIGQRFEREVDGAIAALHLQLRDDGCAGYGEQVVCKCEGIRLSVQFYRMGLRKAVNSA